MTTAKARKQAWTGRESDLVKGIYDGLRYKGRTVLRVGQWRADRAGTDSGCGDLLIFNPETGEWKMLDMKTPTGRISPAQQALVDIGADHRAQYRSRL